MVRTRSLNKNIIDLVDQAKGVGNAENLTLQLIAIVEGNETLATTTKIVYTTPEAAPTKLTKDKANEEGRTALFSIAGMERKKMIKIGVAIVAFFL